jgi:hypothetical protein
LLYLTTVVLWLLNWYTLKPTEPINSRSKRSVLLRLFLFSDMMFEINNAK